MDSKRKIPGMLYIAVSFTPWIAYWALCGRGSAWGVAVAFAISLLLVVSQAVKRSFNLMDITSALYFTVALMGTFALGLEV
ncbi:MAG: all-trans-retinol 13,14-reductase, partial [Candidatus Verstraetearchaeota archaeon]|nr:all-trans-retinol 13,14-reductase [Candidatus Verstraetearchaeota archaeon]